MKYIIRSGKVREQGRYFVLLSSNGACMVRDELLPKCKFAHRADAERWLTLAEQVFGEPARIVRLLSHEEAKEKAAATILRELAAPFSDAIARAPKDPALAGVDMLMKGFERTLLAKANELWPKGKP